MQLTSLRRRLLPLLGFAVVAISAIAASLDDQTSPRLRALETELAQGQRDALAQFWADAKTTGTPLIEPIPDKPGFALVTFLWRGSRETRDVTLLSGPQFLNHYHNRFTRLGDTDVWYLTVAMPEGLRVGYVLAETSVATRGNGESAAKHSSGSDPLNLRRSEYDPGQTPTRTAPYSLFETPNAAPEPWLRRDPRVPRGETETFQIPSRVLDTKRRVTVYRPKARVSASESLGCLYLFDGDSYLDDMHIADVLDNLIAADRIKPTIAVLIGAAPGKDRDQELQCDPKFTDFVCTELVPWVRSHYNVSQAAGDTIIGGYSLGALEATYAASKRPDLFGAILAQSPSLHWAPSDASTHDATPWMAHMLVEAAQRPKRIYLSFGRDEPTITDKVQAFERVLRAAGQEIRCEEIEGQHDPINWRLTFPRGLLWLTGHTQTP